MKILRFLADESCDFEMVRALREAGHDVLAVAEIAPRADDSEIAEKAIGEKRVLLTEDKDFGQMAFAQGKHACGVIFLRYRPTMRKLIANDLVQFVERQVQLVRSSFIVIQPGRVRVRRMPRR